MRAAPHCSASWREQCRLLLAGLEDLNRYKSKPEIGMTVPAQSSDMCSISDSGDRKFPARVGVGQTACGRVRQATKVVRRRGSGPRVFGPGWIEGGVESVLAIAPDRRREEVDRDRVASARAKFAAA
ncbi:hypothetical protein [Pseudoxanthomonas sp. GM95]|uniref:hypothetical protein n=1 Tax=Pseudoxanthomonas sp. GM95 TaxID=1881043 RepID=UPI0011139396|nr:hypothetical protein [Pseudoxanthomonas sp. GM95]